MSGMSPSSSGFTPQEYNVVVKPESVEEKTVGGLIIPESALDKDQYGMGKGVLDAVSPLAFNYPDWPDDAPMPQVGDRVLFIRYAGMLVTGADDEEYRVLKDKDIVAVIKR